MPTALLDIIVFVGFIAAVLTVGILKSRHEKDSEAYFLAGRGLTWWLIGFSLIAANISTEQFVGMSGQAADYIGLAIASYEWMAAVTLVVVAFFFIPKFLRAGIYTIPEFLEYRYSPAARTTMSIFMMIIYIGVTIAAVIYSGAITVDVLFGDVEIFGARPINISTAAWMIGLLAAAYVMAGGLKACAWADLLQGSALILGGAIVVIFAMITLGRTEPALLGLSDEMAGAGGLARFMELNSHKLHMVLPSTDLYVPWTALVVGLWIPNFYYWGLNQYITQRTLGSRSVSEGQKGIVFAAGLKLVIPFIIVVPGMIAFNLYKSEMQEEARAKTNGAALAAFESVKTDPSADKKVFDFNADFAGLYPDLAREMAAFNATVSGLPLSEDLPVAEANARLLDAVSRRNVSRPPAERLEVQRRLIGYQYDSAFALLIKRLIPPGLRGFMLAAILGAVMSSLAAMLNAASTIFTMDLYRQYLRKGASQANLVAVGRLCVAIFVVIGCLIAPLLGDPRFGGIFTYIQEFQGFISPGVLAIFVFGLIVHKAPGACGVTGLVLSPILYGILKLSWPSLAFLDRMAVVFGAVLAVMAIITVIKPLPAPVTLPAQTKIEVASSPRARTWGIVIVAATLILYAIFW
ncbi:MAG: sodium/solute symporter [Vicinamibacteria bacterium]|nr:sodium/solute symporter [Vicinamibacteria bacterium]